MTSTPTQTMRRYFESWKAGEFDAFETLLATVFDLHTTEADAPVLVANWAQVGDDGKIKRIRVTFDPRPILS